jgi:hypothetical protein
MSRPVRWQMFVFCALFAPAMARAQSDFVGVRALGMGEAMRATATGGEAVLLNPAGMSLTKQYVIEGMYGIQIENLGHHAFVSVVDSVTSRVAAGLFYSFIYSNPQAGFDWAGGRVNSATLTRTGHAAGLALSIALGDRFLLGLTTKYLHFDTTAPLPKGAVPSQLTLDTVNGVTWDLGALIRLGDRFNITAIGYNLWDHGSVESPLSLGMGVAYIPVPTLSINFDAVVNFTGHQKVTIDSMDRVHRDNEVSARLGPGLEWLAGGRVPIRAGVVYDTWFAATYLTLGLGYVSSQFGIDLGYRLKVDGGLENFLMLGIRLFVD